MMSKLAVAAVLLVAVAGAFADDYTNNCNAQKKICQNGGVCHENVPALSTDAGSANAWVDPFCVCQAPYGGNDCSYTIRECKDSPCQNGGTCFPADCRQNPNSQYYDCFTCSCNHGWTGAPSYWPYGSTHWGGVCDWKVPDMSCESGNGMCANGGTCTTTTIPDPHGSGAVAGYGYSCQCTVDYFGGQTGQAANRAYNCTAPRCSVSGGACQNGGTCLNPTTNPTCSCGFYGGDYCELPRFCDNANACPDGNTCTNTGPGTGVCTPPSFCSTHTCMNGGTCSGTACSCPAPYDGMNSCNATLFCNSNPCQNGATCFNSPSYLGGAGQCSCAANFAGDFCEKPIVGCAHQQGLQVCRPGSTCTTNHAISTCSCGATQGGINFFDCACNSTAISRCPGNTGSSLTGQAADMVCQNGGSCVESADQTACSCRSGFWGDQCQNYDNPCLNNPCENGGQCYVTAETNGVPLDDRYWAWRCQCKWPFYGKNCEKQAPVSTADGLAPVVCGASNSPCMNGGTCYARTYDMGRGGFFGSDPYTGADVEAEPWACTCPSVAVSGSQYKYMGLQCEIQVEQCSTTTCQNGGVCQNAGDGVNCKCPCGYAGDRCEVPATNIAAASVATFAKDGQGGVGYRLEFCSREPCQNGGTCYHPISGNGFGCSCKSGWAGTYCQYSVRSSAAGVVPSLIAVAAAVAAAFALKH